MFRFVLFLSLMFTVFAAPDADAKRRKKKGPPPVGWQAGEEGQPQCYYAPQWDTLTEIDRRMKRSEAMDDVLNQWRGQRNDGVEFDEGLVEEVETVLLGRPEKIESVVASNQEKCLAGDVGAWQSWARTLKAELTAGECNHPLDYTMFDYLDIGTGWQRPLKICKGNRIQIKGSSKDQYRLKDSGAWITVEGDTATPTTGSEWPCNIEGCFEGMLIMKHVGAKSGMETIIPVGTSAIYTATEDGEISYRINDTSFFDNTWHKSGSVIDHTSIEISPAE